MIIFYIFLVILLIIVALAASKPNHFRIERQIIIQAPASEIFPLVNDFHQWLRWSPWEKIDPALKRQYAGAATGIGSVYEWQGNKNVGEGRMEIIEEKPLERILIQLDFIAPFACNNQAEFTFSSEAGATRVNWAMSGPNRFMGKLMSVFCNMDKMVGKNFEVGLANLKSQAESLPTQRISS